MVLDARMHSSVLATGTFGIEEVCRMSECYMFFSFMYCKELFNRQLYVYLVISQTSGVDTYIHTIYTQLFLQ